jgi:hypothetical protein
VLYSGARKPTGDVVELVDCRTRCGEGVARLADLTALRTHRCQRACLAAAQLGIHEPAQVGRDRDAASQGDLAERSPCLVVDGYRATWF